LKFAFFPFDCCGVVRYQEPLAWQTFIQHNGDVRLFMTFKGFLERIHIFSGSIFRRNAMNVTRGCFKIDHNFLFAHRFSTAVIDYCLKLDYMQTILLIDFLNRKCEVAELCKVS
jgi:hypothetical protein